MATTDHPAQLLTLDDQATRDLARADPVGFVAGLKRPVVLDEAQRAPDLLLAIKDVVDRDTRPGQFLLTGSANVLSNRRVKDALTGPDGDHHPLAAGTERDPRQRGESD